MKKLFVLILLVTSFLCAQEINKGRISLVFNGEKINLPISSVMIRKENHIIVSIRAESNDSTEQKEIAFDLGLNELTSKHDAGILEGTRFNITSRDNAKSTGSDLSINFGNLNKEAAYYRVFNKGEQISWEVNSVSMRIKVSNIVYANGDLIMTGEFSGTFRSTLAKDKEISEIKDGKFKIVI